LIGDHNVDTLFDLRNKKQIDAPCGEPGATQMASGHSGEDLYIKVPIGTSVYDQKSNKLICDIVLDGQKYEICRGGRGGHGNAYFKNSKNRIPALYELGDKGEVRSITLKLRFLADVGIVGLPNAGKSTLITAISHAHPKIANYPFTTLNPVLGTVKYDEKTLTFADIPGLIEDASVGKGLGHDFLKHIERCHVLILLLSLSSNDTDDIIRDYQVLYQELKQYSKKLIKKPILIVGNKIDEDGADLNQEKLAKFLKQKVLVVSAKLQQNTDALIAEIFTNFYTKIMRKKRTLIAKARKLIRPENVVDRTFKIAKVDDHT
jgi:GTP-binding protein